MKLDIYTDGACRGNPGIGAWAYIIVDGSGKILSQDSKAYELTTNNKMELTATIEALKVGKNYSADFISIYTDSQYVKNGITEWIKGWKSNGWRTSSKKAVKNQDLWMRLDELCTNLPLTWRWVKGHNGDKYNEMCDRLCNSTMDNLMRRY